MRESSAPRSIEQLVEQWRERAKSITDESLWPAKDATYDCATELASVLRTLRDSPLPSEVVICDCGTTMICPDIGCDKHKVEGQPPPDEGIAKMTRLAKEATNGWACHAKTEREHRDIHRLHAEISKLETFWRGVRDGRRGENNATRESLQDGARHDSGAPQGIQPGVNSGDVGMAESVEPVRAAASDGDGSADTIARMHILLAEALRCLQDEKYTAVRRKIAYVDVLLHELVARDGRQPADEEEVPHQFRSRTPYEPGDDRDIWCADCEYHRDHQIHAGPDGRRAPDLPADVERELRIYLWLSHGHRGVYGDDGEMQCVECSPVWDYKRAPLADVVLKAIESRQAVNLKALADAPPVAAPPERSEP